MSERSERRARRDEAPDLRSLQSRLRKLAEQGRRLSTEVERGQARTPIADHFTAIGADSSAPLAVILLGADEASRSTALGWLCGEDVRFLSIQDASPGFVTVRLLEGGWALQRASGQRLEFESVDQFAAALQQADLVRPGDDDVLLDPLRLELPTRSGVRGIEVLMPRSVDEVLDSPSLLADLARRSNVLLACGPAAGLSEDQADALAECASVASLLLPLPTTGEDRPPRRGWWSDRQLVGDAEALPPVFLGDPLPPASGFLTDPNSVVAGLTLLLGDAQRLERAADMLLDRIEQDRRQLDTQREHVARDLQVVEDGGKDRGGRRGPVDGIKGVLQDELGRLGTGLEDQSRKAFRSGGAVARPVEEVIGSVGPADLVENEANGVFVLTLDSAVVERLDRTMEQALRRQISQEVSALADGLGLLSEQLTSSMQTLGAGTTTLELAVADEGEMFRRVRDLVQLELRYRGEMPKRGLFARLGEGRRAMYGVMSLAFFGSALGISRRSPMMLGAMLAVFIGAFAYTFVSFKRQDRSRRSKEVDKVQSALRSSASRVLSEAEREKSRLVSGHLDRVGKEAQRRLEGVARETEGRVKAHADQQRAELRQRLKAMEGRVRAAGDQSKPVGRLRQEVVDLRRDVQKALRAAAREEGRER